MIQEKSDFKYVGSIRRSIAAAIDVFIANFIRMLAMMLLGNLWLNNYIIKFRSDFLENFGDELIGRDPERIQFLINHPVFAISLTCLFIVFISGALYHMILNSSKWRATLGKRMMNIIIIKNNGEKLTFLESSYHYFLSLVPWVFVLYIFAYQMVNAVNIYDAIIGNNFNLFFGLITWGWLQIHLITKKKTTAPDMICKILVVEK